MIRETNLHILSEIEVRRMIDNVTDRKARAYFTYKDDSYESTTIFGPFNVDCEVVAEGNDGKYYQVTSLIAGFEVSFGRDSKTYGPGEEVRIGKRVFVGE